MSGRARPRGLVASDDDVMADEPRVTSTDALVDPDARRVIRGDHRVIGIGVMSVTDVHEVMSSELGVIANEDCVTSW